MFKDRKHSAETRQKMSEARRGKYRGKENPNWKGGRRRNGRGYVCIYKPDHPHAMADGYVWEHRLIIEKALGRYLESDEFVHHVNGKRDDNRLENLELVDHHRRRICPRCGWAMTNMRITETI